MPRPRKRPPYTLHDLPTFLKQAGLAATPLDRPLTVDSLGANIVYYAVKEGVVYASATVAALAKLLGVVTADRLAFAELRMFGFILDDKTLLSEIRTVPPGATLYPDGHLKPGRTVRLTREIRTAEQARSALQGVLESTIAAWEPRFTAHVCGLSSGKDTRILAALPKRMPERWHWLNIAGADDGESRGARHHAERLKLAHFRHFDWGLESMTPEEYRKGSLLVGGLWTASEQSKWRYYFRRYCEETLPEALAEGSIAIWSGNLGDGLFGPTLFARPPQTIWDTLSPRIVTTSAFWAHYGLALPLADAVLEQSQVFSTEPFPVKTKRPEEKGYLWRLLTRGRHVSTGLAGFYSITPNVICPYCLPEALDVIFRIDTRLFEQDAVRDAILEHCAPGSTEPNEEGFAAPNHEQRVRECLVKEARECSILETLLDPAFLAMLRLGEIPRRLPADLDREPIPAGFTLRVYDELLGTVAFFNALRDEGVQVQ